MRDADPVPPLTADEEAAWRAVARLFCVLPRVLDAELLTAHGLTLHEYVVLMSLSDEPRGRLRMSDLATRVALSQSGMSRVVDRLVREGLVDRERCPSDGRSFLAVITDVGLERLRAAYPTHLRGVRENVLDHLAGMDLRAFADAVGRFAGDASGPPLRIRPRAARPVGLQDARGIPDQGSDSRSQNGGRTRSNSAGGDG